MDLFHLIGGGLTLDLEIYAPQGPPRNTHPIIRSWLDPMGEICIAGQLSPLLAIDERNREYPVAIKAVRRHLGPAGIASNL